MNNERKNQSQSDNDAVTFMLRRLLTLTEHLYNEVLALRKQMQEVKQ